MPLNYAMNGQLLAFTTAQISAMGIQTAGVEDGTHPTFVFDVNSKTMRAEYFINADQYDNFCCFMLGGQNIYVNDGQNTLTRIPPQLLTYQNVTYKNFAAIKVESATGHKILQDDTTSNPYPIPQYERFRVAVVFQQTPFNVFYTDEELAALSDPREYNRYTQQLPTSSQVDYLSLPGSIAKYVMKPGILGITVTPPHNTPIPYGSGFPVSTSIISQKWIRLPFAAWGKGSDLYNTMFGDIASGLLGLVGTVNQYPIFGYDPGQLLMLAPEEELVLDPTTNELSWNLTYKWSFKASAPHNWFYFWAAGGPSGGLSGWYFSTVDGSSTWIAPGSENDGVSWFNNRDHRLAFQV